MDAHDEALFWQIVDTEEEYADLLTLMGHLADTKRGDTRVYWNDPDAFIRGYISADTEDYVEDDVEDDESLHACCPITAIHYLHTGEILDVDEWGWASSLSGYADEVLAVIMDAADLPLVHPRWHPEIYARARVLHVVMRHVLGWPELEEFC